MICTISYMDKCMLDKQAFAMTNTCLGNDQLIIRKGGGACRYLPVGEFFVVTNLEGILFLQYDWNCMFFQRVI